MGIFRNRKRTTIADVKAEAMQTMGDAKTTLALVQILIGLAEVLVNRLTTNGVVITLDKQEGESLIGMLTSKEAVSFPIGLRVVPVEDEEEPEDGDQ